MRHSGFKRITASIALGSGLGTAIGGSFFVPDEWLSFSLFSVVVWLIGGFAARGKYLASCACGAFQKEGGTWESEAEIESRRKSRPAAPMIHFLWPFARHAQP